VRSCLSNGSDGIPMQADDNNGSMAGSKGGTLGIIGSGCVCGTSVPALIHLPGALVPALTPLPDAMGAAPTPLPSAMCSARKGIGDAIGHEVWIGAHFGVLSLNTTMFCSYE
jgi:hypothetical protein